MAQVPKRWNSREGFLLLGNAVPPSQLHTDNEPVAAIQIHNAVDVSQYSIMKAQTSQLCQDQLNTYYHDIVVDLHEQVKAMKIDTSKLYAAVGLVQRVPDEISDRQPPSLDLKVFDPYSGELDDKDTLRVWTRTVVRTTGVFVGGIIAVVGEITQRDVRQQVVGLSAVDILTPRMPPVPWLLPQAAQEQAVKLPFDSALESLRIHFVAGPYPKPFAGQLLQSVVITAMQRKVDLLVIAGPLVVEPTNDADFDSLFTDQLYRTIEEVHQALPTGDDKPTRTRIILIPSLDDVTLTPVTPQLPYDILPDEFPGFSFATNPCSITIGGLTVGVSSFDALSQLQGEFFEQGCDHQSRPYRIADTVLRTGLYMPLSTTVRPWLDLAHLHRLRLCCVANRPFVKGETGVTKKEEDKEDHVESAAKSLPHIVLATSTKKPFAFRADAAVAGDGQGVLFVNLGTAKALEGQVPVGVERPFQLHVAEITVKNRPAFIKEGPSEAAGVSVGSLLFERAQ